jgi:signal transduction histidine kinase
MATEGTSTEPRHVADPLVPSELDLAGNGALEPAETRLRRVNADLTLQYAVEQQIATAHELSTLVGAILARVQALMQFELAAALITNESGGQLFAVHGAGALAVRAVEQREAQRLLGHARAPIRREADAGGSLADLLVDQPGVRAVETYSVPLSDGRSQIGMLQVVNGLAQSEDSGSVLRRLGLTAAQLGRAVLLQREREAFERAERLLLVGRSVSAVLHDIRTPLASVGHCVNLMAAEDAQELRSEYAARADRALDNLDRMTQELLAFACGKREVLIRQVQLPRFVEEVRELLVPELERFSTKLEVNAEYTGTARFDATKVKRVLWNLARNSCQAGADKFAWRIARQGEQLLFECADTGPGIPPAAQARLFQSFASHATAEGTGLGLAMTKKIIDAHCGRIFVNSDPGHGTVFRIELPL